MLPHGGLYEIMLEHLGEKIYLQATSFAYEYLIPLQ